MINSGVDSFIEYGHGGVLGNMIKRIDSESNITSVDTTDSINTMTSQMISKKNKLYFYGKRTFSRILALQFLYKLEIIPAFNDLIITMDDAGLILNEIQIDGFEDDISNYDSEDIDYANKILNGVINQKDTIDSIIETFATSFPLKDLAIIDKNILRISIFEIKYVELKSKVALDEAIEIAKIFGSENSSSFINGVLDSFIQKINKK